MKIFRNSNFFLDLPRSSALFQSLLQLLACISSTVICSFSAWGQLCKSYKWKWKVNETMMLEMSVSYRWFCSKHFLFWFFIYVKATLSVYLFNIVFNLLRFPRQSWDRSIVSSAFKIHWKILVSGKGNWCKCYKSRYSFVWSSKALVFLQILVNSSQVMV